MGQRRFLWPIMFAAACTSAGGSGSSIPDGVASQAETGSSDGPDGTKPDAVGDDLSAGDDLSNDADAGALASAEPIVDLRVDSDRSGDLDLVGLLDDTDEADWSAARGAVFLANLDDDQSSCDPDVDDIDLPKCHDAADEQVNGESDAADLAPLAILAWPGAPDGTTVGLAVDPPGHVRLFRHVEPTNPIAWTVWADEGVGAAELREGVSLGLEGLDVVRDSAVWDGFVTVTLSVVDDQGKSLGEDHVRMRVSPVMTMHHLLDAEVAYASKLAEQSSVDFREDLDTALAAEGLPKLVGAPYDDQWNQDYFETAYMAMPGPQGEQHVLRVQYRSANVYEDSVKNPLRYAGRFAFDLRGPDSAAIQAFDQGHDPSMDSLNSFGNTETIPPYSKDGVDYPLGRLYRGSVNFFYPDAVFSKLLESQQMQPPVYVDTSWLLVGHVDETVTFLPSKSAARGWTIGVNDARLAKKMLEALEADGKGTAALFKGRYWSAVKKADTTVSKVLDDEDVLTSSAKAAAETDAQLAILMEATGVTADEIVPFPFLHEEQSGYSVAYQPGTVNGILISRTGFGAPKPYGPVVNGKDVFEAQVTEALQPLGIKAYFIEDWNLYHRLLGEVHCGSNVTRAIPTARWWETGR